MAMYKGGKQELFLFLGNYIWAVSCTVPVPYVLCRYKPSKCIIEKELIKQTDLIL
jgi:hypothetical protein